MGSTWSSQPRGAGQLRLRSNQLSLSPDGSTAGFVEAPENASPSLTWCTQRCIQRTSPNGRPIWFDSDYMGRPIGSGTQVVLGHTAINLDFPVVNENQEAVLTDSEMAHRGEMVDSLQRTTLNGIMHITWQDVIGP